MTPIIRPMLSVKAMAAVRAGRRMWYVLPIRGVFYGLISLAIVVGLAVVIDRLLGRMERAGWTDGEQWGRHNKLEIGRAHV